MTLLRIPIDILLLLPLFLEAGDINSLCQTNLWLYSLLHPYLHWHNSKHSQSSALLSAAQHGKEATARLSLQEGTKTGVVDNTGRTTLCLAAQHGHVAVVLLAIKQVDVNTKGFLGRTHCYPGLRRTAT
jgi:ankyrin repeat protein